MYQNAVNNTIDKAGLYHGDNIADISGRKVHDFHETLDQIRMHKLGN